jgi:hypothetical protein
MYFTGRLRSEDFSKYAAACAACDKRSYGCISSGWGGRRPFQSKINGKCTGNTGSKGQIARFTGKHAGISYHDRE